MLKQPSAVHCTKSNTAMIWQDLLTLKIMFFRTLTLLSIVMYCLTKEQMNLLFELCLASFNCENNNCFSGFAIQKLHINKNKSRLYDM